ncbi:glycosyltransferase [Microbacterium sulfonylureivorans]|uniref:glycosyltransferase n=1 Tax=Microbacterium sulfonylureivorans TaxID=2486854 RepID=UPI000FD6FFC4|nr:glycosyltransferase [Microbacterium sulfonylureivorans]
MSRDLVVLSLESWDDIWRRNQYLIDGLLRRDPSLRVLFVEPSNDLLHSAISGRGVKRGRGLRAAQGYEGRLHLFQPDKLMPRVAGPAADALLRGEVRRAVRRLGLSSPVLWVNDPSWAGLVTATDWPSVYDMTDDWLAADRPDRELRRIAANERVLMARCAAVVVCSEGLRETRSSQRDVVLVPNAVDVERYRLPRVRPADLPERAAVYVGTQHEDRLDVELVLRTADAAASVDGSIVLVGPSALAAANVARLAAHPRVVLLGPRPFTDVPAYLQHATVLVVPHVVNDFTDSLDPIKLYEYLAVGRPIVSTPVAGFRSLTSASVTIADASDFAGAVGEELATDRPTVVESTVPDWADRVSAFGDVLAPLYVR